MRTINLLPPDTRKKAGARTKAAGWLLLGVAYIAVLGLLYFWWQGKVEDAELERDQQQAVVDDLRRDVAALGDLQVLKDTYEGRVAVIGGILSVDVSWGRVLNDFGRLIPPRVWLESFSGTVATGPDQVGGQVGQIAVTGTGFDFPDVASWLRSLDSTNFPGVDRAWVSSVTSSQIGEADVVTFVSSTDLTGASLSQRFLERVPEVP